VYEGVYGVCMCVASCVRGTDQIWSEGGEGEDLFTPHRAGALYTRGRGWEGALSGLHARTHAHQGSPHARSRKDRTGQETAWQVIYSKRSHGDMTVLILNYLTEVYDISTYRVPVYSIFTRL
jgi:hypothetical protein